MPRPIPTNEQRKVLQRIQSSNAEYVIGVDEVGYGAWAGPVTVCAAVFEKGWKHADVRDSKRLSAGRRTFLLDTVIDPQSIFYVIKEFSAEEIDRKQSVYKALRELTIAAIQAAVAKFPDSIVVTDGNNTPKVKATVVCLVKADDLAHMVLNLAVEQPVSEELQESLNELELMVRLLSIENPFDAWRALTKEISKVWPKDVSAVDAIREQRDREWNQ